MLVYLLPLFGVIGLIYMFILQGWVTKQDAGDEKMRGIAANIADGAMAFLKAEYRVLAIFVVVAGVLLGIQSTIVTTSHWLIVVAFVIGALFSVLAGFLGMRIATKANVRTTQAARTSLAQALKVSFNGGSVMGLGVAGLAVLGLSMLFAFFYNYFMQGDYATGGSYDAMSRYWKCWLVSRLALNPSHFLRA
jgi:K(+)-stimulated pyrophosphate-energized sodium pump